VWIVFGVILLIVSACDFLFFRIENEYSLALVALYALSCACGASGSNFKTGLTTAVATFVITAILNRFDLIGGGDVKLLFPVILLCENNLSSFLFGLSLGGALLAVVYLLFSRRIFFIRRKLIRRLFSQKQRPRLLSMVLLSLNRVDRKIVALRKYADNPMRREIPYGIAISCGGFCAIFENFAVR
jgi:Flp pilus assembly protein protease CpaA